MGSYRRGLAAKRRQGLLWKKLIRDENAMLKWFIRKGCWKNKKVLITKHKVVAGIGALAKKRINAGELLFRIPRRACLLSSDKGDTQKECVKKIEQNEKRSMHIINSLSFADCAFVWPRMERKVLLKGTELEDVVESKIKRLKNENVSIKNYAHKCALIASHINPWFGGAIVPYSCWLNLGEKVNVIFTQNKNETYVEGRALTCIQKGQELTQAYAYSAAELLYRYGFIPYFWDLGSEDSVSFLLGKDIPSTLSKNAQDWLSRALCFETSPWDGLHYLTAEIFQHGVGISKLFIIAFTSLCDRFLLDQAAPSDDDIAAADLLYYCLNSSFQDDVHEDKDNETITFPLYATTRAQYRLRRIAKKYGGEHGDPWPALLRYAENKFYWKPPSSVIDTAFSFLNQRQNRLLPDPSTSKHLFNSRRFVAASRLRAVEFKIIDQARCALKNQDWR
mmetsp:Transcript_8862/g.13586  ORF Transcript_8862/g.13586 Transcript_8862/m.13586 type:complete len:449 (-) Transcript_8862:2217-3563(-)